MKSDYKGYILAKFQLQKLHVAFLNSSLVTATEHGIL